jgi:hypothetical protein
MPYGIMALSLVYALPGVVVLAAIGASVYWVSLVMKMRHLLGTAEASRRRKQQRLRRDSTVKHRGAEKRPPLLAQDALRPA